MKFVEPPHRKAIMGKWSYDWIAIRTKIRERPNEWLLVAEGAKISVANAIRQGSIKDFSPKDGYVITTVNNDRTVVPATCDLYVKYDPEKDEKENN